MKAYGRETGRKIASWEVGGPKVGSWVTTEEGSVFVDGLVHCREWRFIGRCSGGVNKEVLGIVWLLRVAKQVRTEGRGRFLGIVGGLLWTIRDDLNWVGFGMSWGLIVIICGCAVWDGVLNGVCAEGNPEDGWENIGLGGRGNMFTDETGSWAGNDWWRFRCGVSEL